MWLLLSDLDIAGGERRSISTAVLQATCVDATIIPHLEGRMNASFGCYGCRDATDIEHGEAVIGFPGKMLEPIVQQISSLGRKAITKSRAKGAHARLTGTRGEVMQGHRARALGSLPRLEADMVLSFSSDELTAILGAAMDSDGEAALRIVSETLETKIRKVLDRPHCVPAFEMNQKLSDKG